MNVQPPVGTSRKIIGIITGPFKANPDRIRFAGEYKAHQANQSRSLLRPVSLVTIFAWLGYAFDTDPKLHPEFTTLLYHRLSLSVVGLVIFFSTFIPAARKYSNGWMILLLCTMCFNTASITGRLADDANYMSGYQLVTIIASLAPVSRRILASIHAAGLLLFIAAVIVYAPDLSGPDALYSLNNLAVAFIIAGFALIYLEQFRFNIFISHRQVVEQKEIIEEKMLETERLKTKQDGDYYLTSILLEPLMSNRTGDGEQNHVQIDFLVEQHKKFEFRGRSAEIGGDLCAGHTVRLRGKTYTAFINGDAMGKSIQGAGGAIVLGTVFNSVVARTEKNESISGRYPELWLKECFLEFQNVFVSFEGSMLTSAVIGLVDHDTGLLYYINAEHPWLVLYRDGKASFIENELWLRKIGIDELKGGLEVRTFVMQPGDVIVAGSDGRDDIILSETETGERIINEDEQLFLRLVEQGLGRLELIRDALLEQGKLSDDLSLIRVEYSPAISRTGKNLDSALEKANRQEQAGHPDAAVDILTDAHLSDPANPAVVRRLYEHLSRQKEYLRLALICARYCEHNPSDGDYLFYAGYAYKLAYSQKKDKRLLDKAAEFGERRRLRNRADVRNYVNLIDVYRLLGMTERADMLLTEALPLDPQNSGLAKIKKLLLSA